MYTREHHIRVAPGPHVTFAMAHRALASRIRTSVLDLASLASSSSNLADVVSAATDFRWSVSCASSGAVLLAKHFHGALLRAAVREMNGCVVVMCFQLKLRDNGIVSYEVSGDVSKATIHAFGMFGKADALQDLPMPADLTQCEYDLCVAFLNVIGDITSGRCSLKQATKLKA